MSSNAGRQNRSPPDWGGGSSGEGVNLRHHGDQVATCRSSTIMAVASKVMFCKVHYKYTWGIFPDITHTRQFFDSCKTYTAVPASSVTSGRLSYPYRSFCEFRNFHIVTRQVCKLCMPPTSLTRQFCKFYTKCLSLPGARVYHCKTTQLWIIGFLCKHSRLCSVGVYPEMFYFRFAF